MFEAAFGSHLDDVSKTFGGDQRRFGASTFDEGIGGQCRSVDDLSNRRRLQTRLLTNLMHALNNGIFRGCVGGQNFGRKPLTISFHDHIREGSTNIHAHPGLRLSHRNHLSIWQNVGEAEDQF